jgi:hypothetical protein
MDLDKKLTPSNYRRCTRPEDDDQDEPGCLIPDHTSDFLEENTAVIYNI